MLQLATLPLVKTPTPTPTPNPNQNIQKLKIPYIWYIL